MQAAYQVNTALKAFNTFGIEAYCAYFTKVKQVEQLKLLQPRISANRLFVLGGGSNILLPDFLNAWVLKMEIHGVTLLKETDDAVQIRVGGGMNWHSLVLYALQQGWGGFENLSLIPGTVGAAPIQNIGAYGVELETFVDKVHLYDWQKCASFILDKNECQFGYRNSVFKGELKGKVLITHVDFTLPKVGRYDLQLDYGAIRKQLSEWGIDSASAKEVSEAVIAIRKSKLPDPEKIGNAGSFFKNPIVDKEFCEFLLKRNPHMPHYILPNNEVKIPAGWLIEQCGWKGKRVGAVGCFEHQALVIVNHGGARSKEIKRFAEQIKSSVTKAFGIDLEQEVNYITSNSKH